MKVGLVCWGLAFLLLVSLCTAHQTHGGSTGEHHQSNTEFYSEMDNIVEEYPFQDQPHISPASSEKDKWIASGNLAYYTMLHATKSIYLPVTVRLIFVGFEGDGNQGINLDLANLESWFEHIEHTFHHTWVNLDKNDPNPPKHENQNARVEYTINVEVAKVCPLVTTIIEDAVLQYIRPEDPDFFDPSATTSSELDQNPDFYVDAFSFSYVLGSLVSHLNLGNDAYTLFILNPKSPFVTGDSIYGYRAGFSNQEIHKIYTNGTLKSHIESLPKIKAPVEQKPKASEGEEKPAKPVPPTGKRRSVKFSDFTSESEQWAQSWLARAEGGLAVNPACDINDDSEFCVAEVWESDVIEKVPISEYATTLATYGTPWQSQYIKTIASQGGYEQCLVDGWVSNERFGFIDLTSGPVEWGPIIGGEGVRSKESIPEVPIRAEWRDTTITLEDEDDSPTLAADMERYRSEMALLEAHKTAYCAPPLDETIEFVPDEQCQGIEEQIIIMQEAIASLESQGRSEYHTTILSGGDYEGVNATHAIDNFLSKLGATISSTVRSLFVPPAAALPAETDTRIMREQSHLFTKRVAFHVFVISDHDKYTPRDEKNFNYEEFKRELMKFSLPNQEFTFTVKSIDMSSDPVLAAAFGASLHSVVVPGINVDRGVRANVAEGTFEAAPQLYIDTTSLQQHLLGIASKEQSTKSSTGYDPEGSTHIPVFLFSMGGYLPVFVDRYYQSVSLSNMVVGVQSNFIEWESQMECNAKPVYINLRNPLRSLLASTLQYMAGLVPTHVTYSEAYQTGTQNWLWAGLGNSPLSILSSTGGAASPTVHFSQIQTDNAHRNFVVNSLLKSQHYLNKGVEVLFKQRTTENNLPILKKMHATLALTNLTHYHSEAHAAWLEVATAVASLDWTAALKSADKAIQAADQFYVQARELAERTELAECLHMSPNEQVAPVQSKWNLPAWVLPVTIVFDVIIVLLWFVFRNRKAKLKVN